MEPIEDGRSSPDWPELIPPDARVVVEVGCGDGRAAARHRARNPLAFYVGIESDPASIGLASARLDRLIAAPPAALSLGTPGLAPGSVDCLILGVPLDRCPSVAETLREAARLIAPDGLVLAAVEGRAPADRWATEFGRAGLELVDVEPWGFGVDPFDDSPIGDEARPSPIDGSILRAVRGGGHPRRMIIQTLAATPICSRVRTEEPGALLRTIPGVRTRTDYVKAPLVADQGGAARVLIRQRNILGPRDLAGQRLMSQAGYLLVCEWDDDPAIFPEIAEADHLTFRGCHCVQTSTEPLAAILRAFNPEVAVFPNRIFELPPPRGPRADGPATIVFAALNREPDWPELIPALARVLGDLAGAARVEVLHDRAFFDALPIAEKTFRPFLPYPRYVEALRRADVALLPLAPSRFNRCKSDLKYLECAANGVVCLASPTAYEDSIRHGETGMIYRSSAEFEAHLRRLLADPAFRAQLARAAYRDVARRRMLGTAFRGRYRWYEEMARRLPELDRDLLRRVPELA